MKILKFSAMAVLSLALSAGFTSCSDDDDNGNGNGETGSMAEKVNPAQVFTAGVPTSVDGATITKDSQCRRSWTT